MSKWNSRFAMEFLIVVNCVQTVCMRSEMNLNSHSFNSEGLDTNGSGSCSNNTNRHILLCWQNNDQEYK